ncbi:MAG: hypothetical protein AAFU53_05285, partial [Cyanobacteria bacterium J06632_3]
IFLWFMVKTYTTMPDEKPSSMERSLNHLSSFIVIGLLSFVGAEQLKQPSVTEQAQQIESRSRLANAAKHAPMALFGMMGLQLPSGRKSKYRRRQYRRPRR